MISVFFRRSIGVLANKIGACNCLGLGALPLKSSREFLAEEIRTFNLLAKKKSMEGGEPVGDTSPVVCKHFQESLKRDISATQEILNCVNLQSVSTFVDHIDHCSGNVLTSAIGMMNCAHIVI